MSEPVVFIPGAFCDARLFWHQMMSLSVEHAVHVVTLGKGGTVEEMAQAVQAGAPPRFALAGHGLGGNVALELFRRMPRQVTRLALISTDPLPEPPQVAAEREARIVAVMAGRLPAVMAEEVPEQALCATENRSDVMVHVREMALNMGEGAFVRHSRALQRRPDQQRLLRQANLPALVIAGAADTLVPPRRQEFSAGLLPRAEFLLVPEAGHLPPLEAPETVSAAFARWLKEPLMLR